MTKARSLVGMDVHATKIVAAVLDAETGELTYFRMTGDSAGAAGVLCWFAGPGPGDLWGGPDGLWPRAEPCRPWSRVRGRGTLKDSARAG